MTQNLKQHPEYPYYSADEYGNIYATRFNKVKLKVQSSHGRGYLHFTAIKTGGERKSYLSHRFIYECHFGMIPDGMQINHRDLDKTNNRLDNLELVDQWENMRHGKQNGVQYGAASPNYNRF